MENEVWRWVWTIFAIVMGIAEMFTAGFFLLPFAFGGAVAALLAWLDIAGIWQWVSFFVVSGVSFYFLQRFIKKQDDSDQDPVGANRYLNATATTLTRIDPDSGGGMVRVASEEWRATTDGGAIEEGTQVRVVDIRGTKLIVQALN